uniref:Uncharacterized protein n=1 Tax=Oryza punctata TaxID=4537 RepID=A0A0E0KDY8_ORYPU
MATKIVVGKIPTNDHREDAPRWRPRSRSARRRNVASGNNRRTSNGAWKSCANTAELLHNIVATKALLDNLNFPDNTTINSTVGQIKAMV